MRLRNLYEGLGQEVAIIFGRFNPPHKGHRAAWELAAKSPVWYVGTNESTVGPKDPLPYGIKVEAMTAIWPEVEGHIIAETSWLTLASLVYEKHGDVTLLCLTDEDWVTKTIVQYNGKEGAHGFYNFKQIKQKPTPRLSSATALRDAVTKNDREAFAAAAGVDADTPVAGKPFFDLVAEYLLPYSNAPVKKVAKKKAAPVEGVAEGAPIVVMPRADRLKKAEPTKVRYQGDIVPPTKPPSTEKRGVKGRPGQRPMPDSLKEFAPGDGNDGGDEEDTLLKFARMWYNGDLDTQQKVEQALARQGWEIGELESEEGGAFVIRAGDENGDSYIGFAVADLEESVIESQLDELLDPSSVTAKALRYIGRKFSQAFPWLAVGGVGAGLAATGLLAPLVASVGGVTSAIAALSGETMAYVGAGALAGTPSLIQAVKDLFAADENSIQAGIKRWVEKHVGDENDVAEFMLLHSKSAYLGKSQFRWRAKEWPVKLKALEAEAYLEKHDKSWLDAEKEKSAAAQNIGVGEATRSSALDTTAKRLTDPNDGKTAKLRAAGDKRREEHLKGRDIAKRDSSRKDAWGDYKKEDAAGVGIITKQNSTVDVNKGTPRKNLKAFRLVK